MGTNQAVDVFYVASKLLVDASVLVFVGTMTQAAELQKGFGDDVLALERIEIERSKMVCSQFVHCKTSIYVEKCREVCTHFMTHS